MYKITNYSYDKAKKLNVIIKPSSRKNKKIDIFNSSLFFYKILKIQFYKTGLRK